MFLPVGELTLSNFFIFEGNHIYLALVQLKKIEANSQEEKVCYDDFLKIISTSLRLYF